MAFRFGRGAQAAVRRPKLRQIGKLVSRGDWLRCYLAAMIIRRATPDDALDVLIWRNDPLTRAMSRTQDEVEQQAHVAWFNRALDDAASTLLIGEVGGEKIGMVRFDHGAATEVSININPLCRGRGLGHELLSEALAGAAGDLVAFIKDENLASRRLFERAGFELQITADGLGRYVRRA